jgi:alpha-glucosidase (family GH31 glycosyl hydrolase)
MQINGRGDVHGVFMLSSHAMDVVYEPGRVGFKTLGGPIDMYIFPGPTMLKVVEQYTSITGRPPLYDPRFLGLQQCRYGYKSLEAIKGVVQEYAHHELPLDVVWFDIEYLSCNTN